MGRCLLKLVDGADVFYLEWSTVVDAPVTFGMTLPELKEWTRRETGNEGMRELPRRLARCDENGGASWADHTTADDTIAHNRAGPRERCVSRADIIRFYCREVWECSCGAGNPGYDRACWSCKRRRDPPADRARTKTPAETPLTDEK